MTTKAKSMTFMSSGTLRSRNMCWLLAAGFVALTAPSASSACIQAGGCDGFSVGGSSTPIVLSSALNDYINGNGPLTINCTLHQCISLPFDTVADNWDFGYSFLNLSNLCCPATLEIHLKASTSLPGTDSIVIGGMTPGEARWAASLNDLEASSLCTLVSPSPGNPNGIWNANEEMTCVFDLCALPCSPGGSPFNCIGLPAPTPTMMSLAPQISTSTELNVLVDDDTGVDCINLCYTDCTTVPTVSAWGLLMLTLVLLSGAKVYFGRRRAATA